MVIHMIRHDVLASAVLALVLLGAAPALAQSQLELQVMGQLQRLGINTSGLELTSGQVVQLQLILNANGPGMSRQAKREEVRRVIGS
jgi:hypothetical protein